MRYIFYLFQFLVNSNIFVSLCVLCLYHSSQLLLNSYNLNLSCFVFFSTLFIYNFHRLVRVNKDISKKKKVWIMKNTNFLYSLCFLSLFICFYCFYQFNLNTKLLVLITSVFSLLYPYYLRKIPYTKIIQISITWTTTTVLLLTLENNIIIDVNIILLLIGRFFFVFSITIPFDIRDMTFDKIELKTIPIIFGQKKSKIIALNSIIIFALICYTQFLYSYITIPELLSILICCFIIFLFIINSDLDKKEFYFSFWVESSSIMIYLFLLFSKLIF